jgi:endonuclease/exonuclease/phosphatase (EEP) superfamily protein YafD
MAALLVAAAAVGAAGIGCGEVDSDDATASTVVTFNLCGNVCNDGGNESARFAASLARRIGSTTLLLQEACRSQIEEIDRLLGSTSHYVTSFSEDARGANRCPGDDYGIAVVTTEPIVQRFTLPLPNPGLGGLQLDERRMVCIRTGKLSGRTTICTTHLVRAANDATAHAAQVAALGAHAERLARQGRVIIGGDLNAPATAFTSLMAGYVTAPRRAAAIDRVFATRRHYRVKDEERIPCDCSDHDAVVVTHDRQPRSA